MRKLLFVVVFVVACGGDIAGPPAGLPNAAATRDCGPADGPATAIYLAEDSIELLQPTYPYVRVTILQAVAELPGGSWQIGGGDTGAAAWYNSGPNQYETATSGRISVARVSADLRVDGAVDLRFGARRVRGSFSAEWQPRTVLCG